MGPPHQPGPKPADQPMAAAAIGEGLQQQGQGVVSSVGLPLRVPGGDQRQVLAPMTARQPQPRM